MANNVYDLPETPCMFKPIGISKYQEAAKMLQHDEMLRLMEDEGNITVYNLAYQKLGQLPPYLESMLKPYIESSPDGCFYAKVKGIAGKQTVGVWCALLESPSLPEFLSGGETEMTVWRGKIKGVTFDDRQRWLSTVEARTLTDGSYPATVMQREPTNPQDSNALKLMAYVSYGDMWQQLGYIDRNDAKDIVHSSKTGMTFFTRLISIGKTNDGVFGGLYEVVGIEDQVDGFEALA